MMLRCFIDKRDNGFWRKSAAQRDVGVLYTRLLQGMLAATNSLMFLPVPISSQPKSSMPLKRVTQCELLCCRVAGDGSTDGKGTLNS
jgi:hypothetical protein